MLDYSNKDNSYVFITKYSKDNGQIYVTYANGQVRCVPDNEKNIEIIEEKMAEQVMYALEKKDNLKYLYLGLGISLSALLIVCNACIKGLSEEELILINTISTLGSISFIAEYFSRVKKLNELKKLNYFLENRVKLNKKIKENNIATGLSKKKQELIESSDEVFDFSTIDNYSYKDMLTIDENIKREQVLNFDYNTLKKTL